MLQSNGNNRDGPITTATQDSLNRVNFIERIYGQIKVYDEPESLTMAILGEWGTGKTSAVNLLCEKLGADESVVVMRFTPWALGDRNQLLEEFFVELRRNLGWWARAKQGVASVLVDAALALDGYSKAIGATAGASAILSPKFPPLMRAMYVALKGVALIMRWIFGTPPIAVQKQKVSAILSRSQLRFVIILDDLDRLSDAELLVVMQMVKAVADFDNTVYILCMDDNLVARALDAHYQGLGAAFLEKIILLPHRLPEPSKSRLHAPLRELLEETVGPLGNNEEYLETVIQAGLFTWFENLRQVKRFHLLFKNDWKALRNEVNPIDAIIMTALKLLRPSLWEFVRNNPEVFVDGYRPILLFYDKSQWKEHVEDVTTRWKELVATFPRGKAVTAVLVEIFPLFKGNLNGLGGPLGDASLLRKWQRVADQQRFEFYWRTTLEEWQIPGIELAALVKAMQHPKDFAALIANYAQAEDIYKQQIFEALSQHTDILSDDSAVEVSLTIAPMLTMRERTSRFETLSLYHGEKVIEQALYPTRGPRTFERMIAFFEREESNLDLLARLLNFGGRDQSFYSEGSRSQSNIDASEFKDSFLKIERLFGETVIDHFSEWAARQPIGNSGPLTTLKKVDPIGFKVVIEELSATDKGFLLLMDNLSSTTERSGQLRHILVFRTIKYFFDLKTAKDRLERLAKKLSSSFTEKELSVIEAYKHRRDNPGLYDDDDEEVPTH